MEAIWRFLSGDVPGGFAVPLVLIVVFFPILEYIYRTGDTMRPKTYRRWRWLGPAILLAVYILLWFQTPPKTEPLRIAVLAQPTDQINEWQLEALADMTARSLKNTLENAVINPWSGAIAEYQVPQFDVLERSKYRVYRIKQARSSSTDVLLSDPEDVDERFSLVDFDPVGISLEMSPSILQHLGKRTNPQKAFSGDISGDIIQFYYQGIVHFQQGRTNVARQHFQRALEMDSTFLPARLKLAQSLERGGNNLEAGNEFIRAVQMNAQSVEALIQTGEYFLRQLEWQDAEAPLKVALVEDPHQVRSFLGLSLLHQERLKDLRLDNPIALLEEAVRLDPAFEKARVALADQLIKTTVAYKAANVLEDGLEINPESVGLLLKMGAVELYNGNSEEARSVYTRILKLDAQNATAKYNLGVLDYKAKAYESAEQNFRQSLGMGGSVDGYYYLGMIYKQRGDNVKASQFFMKRWEMRRSDDEAFAKKAKELAEQLEDSEQ